MVGLKDYPGSELEWKQSSQGHRSFELFGGVKLGSLCFSKTFGTLAEAEFDGTKYTFKRMGFLRPQVTIRKYQFEEDLGKLQLTWSGGGALEFHDGQRYSFHRQSFWKSRWGFSNEQGDLLLSMRIRTPFVRHDGEVTIEETGRKDAHTPILILLGWYIIALLAEEGEMVAVSSAGAGAY